MIIDTVRISPSRIGILIGDKGHTKIEIEKEFMCKIHIEETGIVTISSEDGFNVWKAKKGVLAITRGFNLSEIKRLSKDDTDLLVISIESMLGKNKNTLSRVKARLIGTGGKVKKNIERFTGAKIAVYGKTISVLGHIDEVAKAKHAIEMILNHKEIKNVYKYLENIKNTEGEF